MMSVIFQEVPIEAGKYLKDHRREMLVFTVITAVFILLGIICLCLGEYSVFFVPFFFVIYIVPHLIRSLLQERQYLFVYEDKIRYKSTYRIKERELQLTPNEYTVEVRDAMPKLGYSLKLVFRSLDGKKLFTYKAVCTSHHKAQKFRSEIAKYKKDK